MLKLKQLSILAASFIAAPMFADSTTTIITDTACKSNPGALGCPGSSNVNALGQGSIFVHGINVFIYVIGAISVLMVVIGGLRYTLSGGDAAGIRSAKDTIVYALIGLAISMLAFGIVNFVITKIG